MRVVPPHIRLMADRIKATSTPDKMRALQRVMFADVWAEDHLGLHLDPWQRQFVRAKEPRLVLNCGRQIGKSTGTAVRGTHYARFHPNSLTIMISPSDRQSGELFRTTRQMVHEARIPVTPNDDNKRSMTLQNGARLVALPSNAATVRGFAGASQIIVDEAAHVQSDDLLPAITPMLATTSQHATLVLLSTPNGKSGFFYGAYNRAGRTVGWRRWHVPSTECPRITDAFLAEEKAQLGDAMFRQEYLAEFISDGLNPIDSEAFLAGVTDEIKPLFG